MSAQALLINEASLAGITSERFKPRMSHLVAFHIAQLSELLTTDVTGVRLGTRVNSFVNGQVSSQRKTLATNIANM
jgi:hypothetical protein